MRFEKWHALGNAYLLVEQPDAGELSPTRVRRLCDVDTGIGSDGLLEVTGREAARAVVRIWNPDGSTAELSGNGTRIAAAWMLRESGLPEVEIETESKLVRAAPGAPDLVRQELGAVSVGDDEVLDVAGERLGDRPRRRRQPARGRAARRRSRATTCCASGRPSRRIRAFPGERTCSSPRPSRRTTVSVLVWERGAGETAASGSSAVAVAAAAVARGWCSSPVRVAMPGGELVVTITGGDATLEGPAERICAGTTDL